MVKTILIPTDFTVKSLRFVKEAMQQHPGEKVKLILLHGVSNSDSISELLFFSKKKLVESFITNEFRESCMLVANKFGSQIESVSIDVFTGKTNSAFDNFLRGNRVDKVYIPKGYQFKKKHKRSFDLLPYLKKSNVPIVEVDCQIISVGSSEDNLDHLFFTGHSIVELPA